MLLRVSFRRKKNGIQIKWILKRNFLVVPSSKLSRKPVFYFSFGMRKSLNAELQYQQFHFHTRSKRKRVCYESEGRRSQWSVFAVHAHIAARRSH